MKLKSFLFFSAVLFCGFSQNVFAQTIQASSVGRVSSNVGDDDKNSGFNRTRIIKSDNERNTTSNKFSNTQLFDLERQTFALINQKRAELGVSALIWSDDLAKIARLHSENMAKYNFFSHTGQDGLMVDDRADLLGIRKWTAIGENIAYNRGYQKPVEIAVEKWMQSEGHRANLLNNRWKESGIGIAVRADGAYYFTQVFLTRK